MSHRTTVHQLESDFADAMARLYSVGNGLARLRAELDVEAARAAAAPVPAAPARPVPPVPAPATASSTPFAPAPPAVPAGGWVPPAAPPAGGWAPPAAPPAPPGVPWYRREGRVTAALAIAGAVITMAGVAMLLVLAIQQGWFGPGARVAAGAVLAAVLVALGVRGGEADLRTTRDGARVGSAPVALVATGVAAAYLDVVAVTSGYGWVAPGVGLVVAGVLALAGLQLARRWDSELLAVLTVAGAAVLAPVVAGDFGWVVSAFLAVLCLAAWWAGGIATRPTLTLVRTLPVTGSLLAGGVLSGVDSADAVGHLAVAAVVVLATLLTSAVSVRRDREDVTSSVALGLVVTGLLACAAPFTEPTRTLTLAATAAVLLLAATAFSRPPLGPVGSHLVVTSGAAGTLAAVLAVLAGAPSRYVTTGLLLLGLGQLAVAGVSRSRTTLALASGATAVGLTAWLQHPFAVVTTSTALDHDLVAALVDSVVAGGVVAVGVWAVASQRGLSATSRTLTWVAAWLTGLGASATGLVAAGTLAGAEAGHPVTGFTVGHAVATVTWMLAAAWLLLRGLDRAADSDLVLRSGLLLSGVSVAKLFVYDLAALSGIVRSVAFIVTGLVLLATGTRYARAWERRRLTA
ncbi:DUF2339 domain-containing protein [Oryzobacter terrae]|uniref:DUF2339 domain-containing protein n=1 Tax=Oryzobacter terrae TaxID=1620385 RepID=UPI0036719B36